MDGLCSCELFLMVRFIPHFGPFGLNIYWLGCIGSLSSESQWWCTNISNLPLDVKFLHLLHLPLFIIQLQLYSTWLYSVLVISHHNWVLHNTSSMWAGLSQHSCYGHSIKLSWNICNGLQCGFSYSSHLITTVTVQISGRCWRWIIDSCVACHTHDTSTLMTLWTGVAHLETHQRWHQKSTKYQVLAQ